MHFLNRLRKTAAFSNHSDGSEWKVTDTEPAPYAAGSVAAHQPTFTYGIDGSIHKKIEGLTAANGAKAILKKKASPYTGALDHVGTKSDASDTLVTQLKWETSGDEIPENMGYNPSKSRVLGPKGKKGIKKMAYFVVGFEKTASKGKAAKDAGKGIMETLKNWGGKAQTAGKGYWEGARASGDVALKTHLNPMTAAKHYGEAWNAKSLKDKAVAAGKALPSTVATAGYLYGGKKIYDKTLGGSDSGDRGQYMLNNYYG